MSDITQVAREAQYMTNAEKLALCDKVRVYYRTEDPDITVVAEQVLLHEAAYQQMKAVGYPTDWSPEEKYTLRLAQAVLDLSAALEEANKEIVESQKAYNHQAHCAHLLSNKLDGSKRLQELTLANEIRWMRKHEDLLKQIYSLRDWKSPDGVLQVKDLQWVKELEPEARIALEGRK